MKQDELKARIFALAARYPDLGSKIIAQRLQCSQQYVMRMLKTMKEKA